MGTLRFGTFCNPTKPLLLLGCTPFHPTYDLSNENSLLWEGLSFQIMKKLWDTVLKLRRNFCGAVEFGQPPRCWQGFIDIAGFDVASVKGPLLDF